MREFVSFLFAGGLAALLNWGSRFLFSIWLDFELAVVLAFFVGLATGFILMRCFVFERRSRALMPQVSKYVLINALALVQTFAVSVGLVRWVFPAIGFFAGAEGVAHLAGVLVPVVTSYFGHKYLTFR